MSDNKHTLKDRFDNFEPEVDNSVIDKNWQALSKSLPSADTKKNKFGFWFSVSMIAVLIGISGVIAFYFSFNSNDSIQPISENIKEISIKQNSENEVNELQIQNNNSIDTASNNSKQTTENRSLASDPINKNSSKNEINLSQVQNNSSIKFTSTNSKTTKAIDDLVFNSSNKNNSTNKTENTNFQKETDISINISSSIYTENKTENSIASKQIGSRNPKRVQNTKISNFGNKNSASNSQLIAVNHTSNPNTEKAINEINSNNFSKGNRNKAPVENFASSENELNHVFEYLSSIAITFNDSIENPFISTSIINTLDYPDGNSTTKSGNKLSLDVLFGAAYNQNKIHQTLNGTSSNINSNNLNFAGGIEINYHFTNKLTSGIAYNYSSNNINNTISDDQSVKVSQYVITYHPPFDSTFQKDIIENNLTYNQSYQTTSKKSHLIGLNCGYNILNSSKWNLIPEIGFNLKINQFSYNKTAALNSTDTVKIYTLNQPTTDSTWHTTITNYYVSSDYKSIDYTVKNDFKTSFGITPGITIGYNINNRFGAFIKASYYIDLMQNKINNNELENKIKQNIMFAHFGIRIKL